LTNFTRRKDRDPIVIYSEPVPLSRDGVDGDDPVDDLSEELPSWPVVIMTKEEITQLYPEPNRVGLVRKRQRDQANLNRLYSGNFRKISYNSKDYGVFVINSKNRSKSKQIRVLENNNVFNEILMKFIKIFTVNQINNLQSFFEGKVGRPGRRRADPDGDDRKM
jgi:hypothetical protein